MLKDMTKIRIVGTKTIMPNIIEKLHELKVLHIVETPQQDLDIGKPLMNAEELSSALVKVRAVASQLNIALDGSDTKEKNIRKIVKDVNKLTEKLKILNEQIKESEQNIKNCQEALEKSGILKALELDSLPKFESIDYILGYIKNANDFKEKLSTSKFMFKSAKIQNKEVFVLFIAQEHVQIAKSLLSSYEFSPIIIHDVAENEKSMHARLKKLSAAKKTIQNEIENLKKEHMKILSGYEYTLAMELEKAEAPLRFKETDQAFLIWGFVPKENMKKTIDALNKSAHNKILIEECGIEHNEKVPVALKNPEPVKNFEILLNLYSLPKYKEIDPSWFLFMTFPLLFGFMLGDMGYGLVTLILFWLLKKKMPQFSSFFNILIFASIATLFFGAIFGEFFGTEPYPPILSRNPEHHLEPLIITVVIVGIVHINAGLMAGFINEYHAHGFKKAFFEKFGWFFLQLAAALLGLSYSKVLPISPWFGYSVLAIAIIILYKGEGVRGLVEIPSIFGNILSYARLMAIGLSSVGLAIVVNELAGGFFEKGGISIILGVLLLVVGHVINIGIGLLGSFLHSLRLHYVELFSKFYKGGGITFRPFGAKIE